MPGRDMGRTLQEATLPGSVRYGVLSKERKHELFGLECADALEWRNWTPGTEYSKNYVVKNVSTETVRISYKQTASKAFSMDFPETIKLRPGMSHALKVRMGMGRQHVGGATPRSQGLWCGAWPQGMHGAKGTMGRDAALCMGPSGHVQAAESHRARVGGNFCCTLRSGD